MPLFSRLFLTGLTLAMVGASLVRPRRAERLRSATPRLEHDVLIVGDGARLPFEAWQPAEPPKAVVLGLHSFGDYRRAFRVAGPWLAAHGLVVLAYDQRGFGETAERGIWAGADVLIQDFADAVDVLRRSYPDIPLVVLGESMGAAVALAGLSAGDVTGVDRLIAVAPGVRGQMPLRQLHDAVLRLAALALPWLAIELRRGGRPWLEPSEAARLADDPLILRELSVGTYEGLIELATIASADLRGELPPTMLLYGELDGTIPRRAINDLAALLDQRDEVRIYPDRHHLMLHEKATQQVLADCLDWLGLGNTTH